MAWSASAFERIPIATLDMMMHQMVLKPKPIPIAITATMIRRALMAK